MALKNALHDARAFEQGGADGLIFENNYDIPHHPFVGAETVAAMTFLGEKIKRASALPVGVNLLWNDYKAGLSIAKTLGLSFVRIPVFVDTVKTDCGTITGEARKVIYFRKKYRRRMSLCSLTFM